LLKRRKEIYEAKYPETRAYSSERQAQRRKKQPNEIISSGFTQDTASKTGFTPRSVQQDIQIANNIDEALKEQIRHTPLADNKVELLKLSRLEPGQEKESSEKRNDFVCRTVRFSSTHGGIPLADYTHDEGVPRHPFHYQ
jgi:ParB family chromosome partitioning protein